MILTANDVADAKVGIVGARGQVIGRQAVTAQQGEVLDLVGQLALLPIHAIHKSQRPPLAARHAIAQRKRLPRRGAGVAGWRRAIPACIHALAEEADWTWVGAKPAAWHPVQVASDAQRKPSAMLTVGRLRPLVILGAVASGVAHNERGWRVRLDTGLEATLVREPGGRWYADDLDEAHHDPASKKRR